MKMQRMLLVVAEHLKHDGVALHVLDEGLGDLHGNLLPPRQKEKKEGTSHKNHPTAASVLRLCAPTFCTW